MQLMFSCVIIWSKIWGANGAFGGRGSGPGRTPLLSRGRALLKGPQRVRGPLSDCEVAFNELLPIARMHKAIMKPAEIEALWKAEGYTKARGPAAGKMEAFDGRLGWTY